jgi:hypothetical protein
MDSSQVPKARGTLDHNRFVLASPNFLASCWGRDRHTVGERRAASQPLSSQEPCVVVVASAFASCVVPGLGLGPANQPQGSSDPPVKNGAHRTSAFLHFDSPTILYWYNFTWGNEHFDFSKIPVSSVSVERRTCVDCPWSLHELVSLLQNFTKSFSVCTTTGSVNIYFWVSSMLPKGITFHVTLQPMRTRLSSPTEPPAAHVFCRQTRFICFLLCDTMG